MCASVNCDLFLYADDSFLFSSSRDFYELQDTLTRNMHSLGVWLTENKLTLHPSKCKSILFNTKRKLHKISKLDIVYNDILFEQCTEVKYLGIKLDQDLSGTSIWKHIQGKINGGLKFLYRKADFLNLENRRLLCNALLQPHFDYACNAWYWGLTKTQKCKLQVLQNKVVRFILGLDNRSHLDSNHFESLKMLKVEDRVSFLALNRMYDVNLSLAPDYLNEFFTKISDVHSYNTRQSHGFFVKPVNIYGKKTFSYNGTILWNRLPRFFTELNKNVFKTKCRKYFFDKRNQDETDIYLR